MKKILNFPKNFLWGAACAAYQVEGGNIYSDWADFYPAGIACDHYHRYEEDFDWIVKLNQNAHRFSIEWARIEKKEGKFDQKEIEHYRKVLLALKERNIKTMVTLFHFTLPKWFAKKGAFTKKKNIYYFQRFANKVFDEYKDLVDFWITENEPQVYLGQGYLAKVWPPKKRNPMLYLKVLKNLISAHKLIYKDFHRKDSQVLVGIAKNNQFFEPYNKKSIFDKVVVKIADWWQNQYFLKKIRNHLDFIGLNYYFHYRIKFPFIFKNEDKIVSDVGWEIYPEGIYHLLKDLKKYHLPIYITENGLADENDHLRKDFIRDHLYWIWKAIQDGVDVKGYFHWSLIDNFEWEKKFEPRFGLIEINYQTLERKPRNSAFYYAEICKNNQLELDDSAT
ncbi:glycoside hydrolase family 1 protein [bacterium]|nr:glycoside hydrolase family 1 protein [bacterium]